MKKIALALAVLSLSAISAQAANSPAARVEIVPNLIYEPLPMRTEDPAPPAPATICGTAPDCVVVTWNASTSAAACLPTSAPPCTFSYNVLRGTAAGAESSTPVNTAPITALTFTDGTFTLGTAPVTFFYVVEAVETVGTVPKTSTPSNEVSAAFPGVPASPSGLGVSAVQ